MSSSTTGCTAFIRKLLSSTSLSWIAAGTLTVAMVSSGRAEIVYYSDYTAQTVHRYDTTTATDTTIISGLAQVSDLAVVGNKLLVVNGQRVSSYTTSGTLLNSNFITANLGSPFAIAVTTDAILVYNAQYYNINKYSLATGSLLGTLVSSITNTNDILVSGNTLYIGMDSGVRRLNATTGALLQSYYYAASASAIGYTGTQLLVGSNNLAQSVMDSTAVGAAPLLTGLAVKSMEVSGDNLYVADSISNRILMYSISAPLSAPIVLSTGSVNSYGITVGAAGVTIGSGSVVLASSLATGDTPSFQSGVLQMDQAGGSYAQPFTLTGPSNTIDQKANASTFSGAFANDTSGAGDLVISNTGASGTGSVTLTGTNTYTGSTTINAGAKLALSGGGSVATSSGLTANGVFDITGTTSGAAVRSLAGSGSVTLGGQTLTLTAASSTFSGVLSGNGGLTVAGGTETLTGVNTYTGATSINAGATLALSGAGSIANSSGVQNAGTFDVSNVSGGTASITSINGAGAVTLGGATLSLTSGSSYIGSTDNTGAVIVGADTSLSLASGYFGSDFTVNPGATLIVANGTTLDNLHLVSSGSQQATFRTASASIINAVSLSGSAVFDTSGNLTLNSALIDGAQAGTLVKNGTGSVMFLANNSYSGGTIINAGSVILYGDLSLSAPGGTLGSGAVTNNARLILSRAGAYTLANTISGTGILSQMLGVATLTASNTYTGATAIDVGATLALSGAGSIASSSGVLNYGVLDISATNSGASITTIGGSGSVVLGSRTLTLTAAGGLFGGVISGAGGGVTIAGGAEILAGGNSYTGVTTVDSGATLALSGAGSIATSSGLVTNGTFDISATAGASVRTLSGSGSVVLGSAVLTLSNAAGSFGGVISGAGGLTLMAGAQTLLGANTYTGGTTVTAGTLTGNTTSLQGNIVDNGALVFDQRANGTYAGAISGTGPVTKIGAGTLILTGTNTFAGNMTISVGGVQVGAGGTSGTLGVGAIINNASLVFNRSDNITVGNDLSGAGSVTLLGSGAVRLTGTSTYTGGTIISGGRLVGTASSLQGPITNNAALDFDQAIAGSFAGVISGTGSVTKMGVGNLTLSGANSYTGGTTISAGTLTGNTTTLQGNVINNAALVFDLASAGSFAGAISGTGAVTKIGVGNLTLTGANSYTGGTTISAGTLTGNATTLQGAIIDNGALVFDVAATGTFSGAVSGAGTVTKIGAGTLIVTGTSSFSGGTTIGAGTVQVGAGGASGALGSGAIVNNGALVINRSDNITVGNTLSGTGSVSLVGSGTVTLAAATSYTGATNIGAGATLALTGSGSIATSAGLSNAGIFDISGTSNGALVNQIAGPGTVALGSKSLEIQSGLNGIGRVTGGGCLIVDGGASLALAAGNGSFSGCVVVKSNASLGMGAASALGSATLSLVGSPTVPATFTTTASMTLSNAISVAYDPTFNVAPGTTLTVTSAIANGAAAGDVTVNGGGTLQLAAANTYTGSTTIVAGSRLALSGAGSIATSSTVTNAGVFDLTGAASRVSLNGSYTQTGGLMMNLSPTGAQSLAVTGAASLGGTLQLVASPGTYTSGRYTLLTAGSLSGAFANVTSNLGSYTSLYTSVLYQNNGAILYIGANPTNTYGSVQRASAEVRNRLVANEAALTSILGYDSNTFGSKNWSLSFIGRYNALASEVGTGAGAGALVAAHRITSNVRLGAFVDYSAMRDVTGRIEQRDVQPTVGAFVVWEDKADLTGWSARASIARGNDKLMLTRQVVGDSEAGSGKASVTSFGAAAEVAYGFALNGIVAQPYAGLRRTDVKRGAYGEATSDVVMTPLSYNAYGTLQTSATLGLRLRGAVTDRLGFSVSVGGEYDLDHQIGNYGGVSTIPTLESFSIAMTAHGARLRANGSAAMSYAVAADQQLSGEVYLRQQAWSSTPAFVSMVKYSVGF